MNDYEYNVQSGLARTNPWTAYTYHFFTEEEKAIEACEKEVKRDKDCVVVRWTDTYTEMADPTVVYDPKRRQSDEKT